MSTYRPARVTRTVPRDASRTIEAKRATRSMRAARTADSPRAIDWDALAADLGAELGAGCRA